MDRIWTWRAVWSSLAAMQKERGPPRSHSWRSGARRTEPRTGAIGPDRRRHGRWCRPAVAASGGYGRIVPWLVARPLELRFRIDAGRERKRVGGGGRGCGGAAGARSCTSSLPRHGASAGAARPRWRGDRCKAGGRGRSGCGSCGRRLAKRSRVGWPGVGLNPGNAQRRRRRRSCAGRRVWRRGRRDRSHPAAGAGTCRRRPSGRLLPLGSLGGRPMPLRYSLATSLVRWRPRWTR